VQEEASTGNWEETYNCWRCRYLNFGDEKLWRCHCHWPTVTVVIVLNSYVLYSQLGTDRRIFRIGLKITWTWERELTFTFDVVVRPSVCLSLTYCRLSVMFVHPIQAIEILSNVSTSFNTLAIHWHPCKILRRSSQGNPSVWGVNHKRGSQI